MLSMLIYPCSMLERKVKDSIGLHELCNSKTRENSGNGYMRFAAMDKLRCPIPPVRRNLGLCFSKRDMVFVSVFTL
jgi:hypothetical protein